MLRQCAAGIAMVSMLTLGQGQAHAESTNNLRVVGVGVQGGQIYFTFASTPPGCPNAIIYQSVDATGQFAMSIALTARTANLPLARIDYHRQGDNGPCWLDLVQL